MNDKREERELRRIVKSKPCKCGHSRAAHMEGECAACGCEQYRVAAKSEGAECLREGWPKCCGYTMSLERSSP